MGIYTSSKGEEVETGTMNSFRLVNGLVKVAIEVGKDEDDQKARMNVQVLSAEIISRLAPPVETPE